MCCKCVINALAHCCEYSKNLQRQLWHRCVQILSQWNVHIKPHSASRFGFQLIIMMTSWGSGMAQSVKSGSRDSGIRPGRPWSLAGRPGRLSPSEVLSTISPAWPAAVRRCAEAWEPSCSGSLSPVHLPTLQLSSTRPQPPCMLATLSSWSFVAFLKSETIWSDTHEASCRDQRSWLIACCYHVHASPINLGFDQCNWSLCIRGFLHWAILPALRSHGATDTYYPSLRPCLLSFVLYGYPNHLLCRCKIDRWPHLPR